MTQDEICSGCLTYEKVDMCLGYKLKDISCPCIICLIKIMCDTPCQDYEDSRNKKRYRDYVGG